MHRFVYSLILVAVSAVAVVADEPPLEPIPLPAPLAKAEDAGTTDPQVEATSARMPLEGPVFPDASSIIVDEAPIIEEPVINSPVMPERVQIQPQAVPSRQSSAPMYIPNQQVAPAPSSSGVVRTQPVPNAVPSGRAAPIQNSVVMQTPSAYVTTVGPGSRAYYRVAPQNVVPTPYNQVVQRQYQTQVQHPGGAVVYRVTPNRYVTYQVQVQTPGVQLQAPAGVGVVPVPVAVPVRPVPRYVPGQPVRNRIRSLWW